MKNHFKYLKINKSYLSLETSVCEILLNHNTTLGTTQTEDFPTKIRNSISLYIDHENIFTYKVL